MIRDRLGISSRTIQDTMTKPHTWSDGGRGHRVRQCRTLCMSEAPHRWLHSLRLSYPNSCFLSHFCNLNVVAQNKRDTYASIGRYKICKHDNLHEKIVYWLPRALINLRDAPLISLVVFSLSLACMHSALSFSPCIMNHPDSLFLSLSLSSCNFLSLEPFVYASLRNCLSPLLLFATLHVYLSLTKWSHI
jgi:hypothetical protein